jgi:hypothetical protein
MEDDLEKRIAGLEAWWTPVAPAVLALLAK